MTSQKTSKMNQVLQKWPRGTVATQAWLNKLGVSNKLANWHVGSGWLVRFGSGAFAQAGDSVDWRGALYALQTQLAMTVHVGGRTALELEGRSHFVPLGTQKQIILISDRSETLPAWFLNHRWDVHLEHHTIRLFDEVPTTATVTQDCGRFDVLMSSTERAIMEQMHLARSNEDVTQAYQLMEGLTALRPNVVQVLLEHCRSAKVKRLFLWSAEACQHAWFSRVDLSRVNLGKGKRQIYKGGQFNQKYQITVPKQEELPNV
jgi:hypothetical protein